ncbi:MAG: hypothetical protein IJR66_05400 [Clostridia bacterium]|nr:hypothetical protein [Clostridia bacterium]
MKSVLNVSKIVFLGLGAVIGAGFISGAEPISFFGLNGFVLFLIFSLFLFCISFCLVLSVANDCGGYEGVKKQVFFNNKLMSFFSVLSLFITFSAMLSAVDEILFITLFNRKIKIFSLILLAVLPFITKSGIRFIEKLNLFISPIILLIAVYIFATKKGFDFSYRRDGIFTLFKSFLFVFSNVFLTFPVLSDSAYKKSRSEIFFASIILSVLLFLIALFILASIKYAKINEKTVFPFLLSIGKNYRAPFLALLSISVFTSLFLTFYSLYNFAFDIGKSVGVFSLLTLSYCFSRLGVLSIIDYAYPIIGVFGFIAVILCARYKIGIKYKKIRKVNNTVKGVQL